MTPAGAVGLAELKLLHGGVPVQDGRHKEPAEPVFAVAVGVRQPAVVRPAHGNLSVSAGAHGHAQEDSGIEDLDVSAQLIHVLEPHVQVAHLRGVGGGPGALGGERAFVGHHAVEEPELAIPFGRGIRAGLREHAGADGSVVALHIAPGHLGLDHVAINVNDRHPPLPFCARVRSPCVSGEWEKGRESTTCQRREPTPPRCRATR